MKKQKISKKLTLNKMTVDNMSDVKGGILMTIDDRLCFPDITALKKDDQQK